MSIDREMRKAVQNAHLVFWELAVPYICYAATKAAVVQFTVSSLRSMPRSGIRANSILPGMMNTPMVHAPGVIAAYGGSTEEIVRRRDEQRPMG
jgi:NAD(P)-dependent dehydrogenase (short-subunit alcohol dehydrogenase family)